MANPTICHIENVEGIGLLFNNLIYDIALRDELLICFLQNFPIVLVILYKKILV